MHTGIKADAIVNIANVLIGNIDVAYNTIAVNATKIPPRAISLAFIKFPLLAAAYKIPTKTFA